MHRWRYGVITAVVAVFLAAVPFSANVIGVLSNGFGLADTESQRGLEILGRELDAPSMSMVVAFTHANQHYLDKEYQISVTEIMNEVLHSDAQIVSIVDPYTTGDTRMTSSEGKTIYALVLLDTSLERGMELVPEVRATIASVEYPEGLSVYVTGEAAIFYDMNVTSEKDLQRAEAVALPVLLVVLILVFGSLVAAGLPILLAVFSVIITMGIVFGMAQAMSISIFVLNIATLLGLGVAVDYALLMITRMREELLHRTVGEAVATTVSTAGKAILFSALTSILGLSALLFFDMSMLQSLGIGGVLVISISLVLALTLLPAALAALGPKINSLRVLPTRNITGRYWYSLSTWVMRHPLWVLLPLVVFLVVLGTPFLRVKLGVPWVSILPTEVESRLGWDKLSTTIGEGQTSPILLVYHSPSTVHSPENLQALRSVAEELAVDERVTSLDSIVTLTDSDDMVAWAGIIASKETQLPLQTRRVLDQLSSENTTVIRVYTRGSPVSDRVAGFVRELRSEAQAGDMTLYVSGSAADMIDTIESMYSDFPLAILYIFVSTYVLLFILFRSVLLPLKAVLMNILSISASYGALVLIFQDGNLSNLLSFTSTGIIEATAPIVLFCIIFGLSMDYEVFLLTRVKELYDGNQDNTLSVAQGLEKTGSIITSAALLMVIVCGSFAFADIVIVKLLGVGLGVAIAMDASIIRALIVPALMRLMGNLNWWAPGWLSVKRRR